MRRRNLNPEQVRELRAAWKPRPSLIQLGRRYGIGPKSVAKILRGETYKEIRA
jgi:hypothetical protein